MFYKKRNSFQISLALIGVCILIVAAGLVFSPVSWDKIAQAVTGDYSKSTGDSLDVTDWNNLPSDFLDKTANDTKEGDLTMNSGNINMNGNAISNLTDPVNPTDAVNQQTMDNAINSALGSVSIQDTSGNTLRMVCGVSPTGIWTDYGNSVLAVVDTSAANFTSDDVEYYVNLSGSNAGATIGANTMYYADRDSFELHITYTAWDGSFPGITGSQANSWGWRAHWCGVGQ